MKCYQILFSPTGGTQKVLQILQNAWDTPAQEIDFVLEYDTDYVQSALA